MGYGYSRHALDRIRQRGFRESDVEFIVDHGTPTADGFVLTGRDVDHRMTELKRELCRLRHLKGSFVAVADDTRRNRSLHHAVNGTVFDTPAR